MKKIAILIVLNGLCILLLAQPTFFSWQRPGTGVNKGNNYISPAKDQGEQGPCAIFAAVADIEALSHIYYNKPFPINSSGLNLSEAEMYSICSGHGMVEGAANVWETFNYSAANGIVDEACFPIQRCFYFIVILVINVPRRHKK